MEPRKPGSEELPDFNELNDRVIAERRTSGPILVVKTNLDPENSMEDNPYYKNESLTDTKEFRKYFEDDSYE